MTAVVRAARAAACALLLACGLQASSALVAVPALRGHVTDTTSTLAAAEQAALEARLAAFEARKGAQVAVLLVATTQPEPIEAYALRVAEQWKLGRRKVDDGAILVVAKDDRALRIEVGYGLEGALNDATCKRIVDEVIVPRLRQGDVAGGVAAGVDRIIGVIDGEPLPAPPPGGGMPDLDGVAGALPFLALAVLVVGGVLRALFGRLRGAAATGAVAGLATWWYGGGFLVALGAALVAMLLTLVGAFGLLARGGRGAGRGGGFGGGGGGFGGGGASGKW